MTNEEYIATQQQLILAAQVINQLDLGSFLDRIGAAHAMGPILDPTLYRKGVAKMSLVERLAKAASEFQKVTKEVFKELEEINNEIFNRRSSSITG